MLVFSCQGSYKSVRESSLHYFHALHYTSLTCVVFSNLISQTATVYMYVMMFSVSLKISASLVHAKLIIVYFTKLKDITES